MSFTFWVTSNCNLNCKYCYEGEEKYIKTMEKEVADNAMDFVYKHLNSSDKLKISFHGGEPFIAFEIMKYIVNKMKKSCMEKGIDVSFYTTTNATLLDSEMIEFIVKEMPDITVSLDGTKETHNKMRLFKDGSGSYDVAIKNSLLLLKRLPNIRVRMTFDSDTVINLFDNVIHLLKLGFKIIVPAPNLFDPNWDSTSVEALSEQMRLIKIYIEEHGLEAIVSIVDKDVYYVKGKCNGGKTSFHIYPNGKLYPCVMAAGIDEFCIGNILSGIDTKIRDKILNYSIDENPDCIGCSLYKSCDGTRCKIVNKVITGDYNKPPVMHCVMENLKYKLH